MSIFYMILGIVLYFIAQDKSQDNVAWFGVSLFALGIYQTFSV